MLPRGFRDNYLLANALGKAFVAFSPPVADFIRGHEGLRTATKVLLPIIYGVELTCPPKIVPLVIRVLL